MAQLFTTPHYVRHECGHLVIARVLGFPTGGIVFEKGRAEWGAVIDLRISCLTIEDVSDFLMRRVQVIYAGAIAQTLEGTKINPKKCQMLLNGPKPYWERPHTISRS